jgi:hypothetical protein
MLPTVRLAGSSAVRQKMKRFLLFSLCISLAWACSSHDSHLIEPSPREVGHAHQSYLSHPYGEGRHLLSGTVAPIRIKWYMSDVSDLTSSQLTFLEDTLLPAASSWLSDTLSVVPVSGELGVCVTVTVTLRPNLLPVNV